MGVDATAAVIHALRDYLKAALPPALAGTDDPTGAVAYVVEAWPAPEDIMNYPTVAIEAMEKGEKSGCFPFLVSTMNSPTDPVGLVSTYCSGVWVIPLTLTVFADTQDQRTRVLSALETALSGDWQPTATGPPVDEDILELETSEYHNQPVSYRVTESARFTDSAARVREGEWHARFVLEAEICDINVVNEKKFTELDVTFTVEVPLSPQAPLQETKKIFTTP